MPLRNLTRATAAVLVLLFMTIPAFSESLWKDGSSLVADQRPDSVGDIVTVAVKENTEAKDEANTEITKDNESNASDGIGIFDFIRKLGFSSSSSMEGDGSTERTHNLTTTVTCIVTEVLPGGNLRLEGRKNIKVQDETMSLKIDGLARPRDVGPDNVIDSDRLANVTVSVDGIGSLSDVQTPGLLTRLFNAIF